ncbi:hypothetical protein DOJK_01885 [Patescibacteria group bacterium]|nr:hypothetical protein DOJK_01885 [Patescibacteria group bacterium]
MPIVLAQASERTLNELWAIRILKQDRANSLLRSSVLWPKS